MADFYIPGENEIRPGTYQRHVNPEAEQQIQNQTSNTGDSSEYLNAWLTDDGKLIIVKRTSASGPVFSVRSGYDNGDLLFIEGDGFYEAANTDFNLNENGELEVIYS